MGLGSGIRKKLIPDPGSSGQKGTGSRIRNTGLLYVVLDVSQSPHYATIQSCGSGSGIQCLLTHGSGILDSGWAKNQDPDPGSGMKILGHRAYVSLCVSVNENNSRLAIFCVFGTYPVLYQSSPVHISLQ
jgi:hypothetical protein